MESSSTRMFLQRVSQIPFHISQSLPWLFQTMMGHSHKQFRKFKRKKQPLFRKSRKPFPDLVCIELSVHCNLCLLCLVFSQSNLFPLHSWNRSCNWELWEGLCYISLTHLCLAIASSRYFADSKGKEPELTDWVLL